MEYVFSGCTDLTAINLLSKEPCTIDSTTFSGINENARFYCYTSALDLYKNADNWGSVADKLTCDDLRLYFILSAIAQKNYFLAKDNVSLLEDNIANIKQSLEDVRQLTNNFVNSGTVDALEIKINKSTEDIANIYGELEDVRQLINNNITFATTEDILAIFSEEV
jgi:hypothetical protein